MSQTDDATDLVVLSESDIEAIATDMYVDFRELMSDDAAAEAVTIVVDRLTDDFYYE